MTDDFREDCERHISIPNYGGIIYQSVLEKQYPGRIGRLLTIVEDHIYEDQDGSETIDWEAVWKDYSLLVGGPKHA